MTTITLTWYDLHAKLQAARDEGYRLGYSSGQTAAYRAIGADGPIGQIITHNMAHFNRKTTKDIAAALGIMLTGRSCPDTKLLCRALKDAGWTRKYLSQGGKTVYVWMAPA